MGGRGTPTLPVLINQLRRHFSRARVPDRLINSLLLGGAGVRAAHGWVGPGQSGPPSPPELPDGTTTTRSSLGTGVPRPSLFEVVNQSRPCRSATTVSSRP